MNNPTETKPKTAPHASAGGPAASDAGRNGHPCRSGRRRWRNLAGVHCTAETKAEKATAVDGARLQSSSDPEQSLNSWLLAEKFHLNR
jgi:hypothetical protein